jgi:ribosomal protein S18 acetylase RimI-like enzyme
MGSVMGSMSASILIRLAELRDAQAVAVMSRDHIETGLGWKYDAARVMRAIRHRETCVLVACDRRAPIAFAIMEFGDERAHLVLLAVQPRFRRHGIGRALVDWLLASARTAGIESVHLELRASNEAAQRFYRALGFSETMIVPRYYGDREAAMRMIRVLRTPGPLPVAWRPPALGQK